MIFALRTDIAIFTLAILAPGTLYAQQLSQPTSLMPWVATQIETAKPLQLNEIVPEFTHGKPVWMTKTAPKAAIKYPAPKKLPMVEQHHYANLGDVPAGAANPSVVARQKLTPSSPVTDSPVTDSPVTQRTQVAAPLRFFRRVR